MSDWEAFKDYVDSPEFDEDNRVLHTIFTILCIIGIIGILIVF